MEIKKLLQEARDIWGEEKLTVGEIIVRMGKVFGDLCHWERDSLKDKKTHTDKELKKELGNMIFSTIRWCDDLGYNPEECIAKSIKAQIILSNENRQGQKQKNTQTKMNIFSLADKGKELWGKDDVDLEKMIIIFGKIYGDICRWERNYSRDIKCHSDNELMKEFGSVIFCSIKFCNDLGYNPEECIEIAEQSQRKFVEKNRK